MTAVPPVSGAPAPPDPGMHWINWVIGGIVLVLCIVGLLTFSAGQENERAQQLNDRLALPFHPVHHPERRSRRWIDVCVSARCCLPCRS